MFHWICPECGREIAPTVRECSVCDAVAATVETALAGDVEAPAGAVKLREKTAGTVAAVAPSTVIQPKQVVPLSRSLAPNVALRPGAAAAPSQAAALGNGVAEIPALLTNPKLPLYASAPADSDCVLAPRVPSIALLAARARDPQPAADATSDSRPQFAAAAIGAPRDGHAAIVESIRNSAAHFMQPEPPASKAMPLAVLVVPSAVRALIAELRPSAAELAAPLAPLQQPQARPEPAPLTCAIRLALRSSPAIEVHPLGAKLLPLSVQICAPVLPDTGPLDLAPALAPLGNYSPLAGRPLRPSVPAPDILKKECGPRSTLPGPMLTRRLVKFMDRELGPIAPAFLRAKKRMIPGWMATALILGTLLGAGFTSVITIVRPSTDAKTLIPAQRETAVAAQQASVIPPPSAQAIEVTGFRIRMDSANKSEIQYLLVNHSSARLTGQTVHVTLYAADAKAGQAPVCKFQFEAPSLAPFQAKDMTSVIDQVNRPRGVPDWQELRASVELGP